MKILIRQFLGQNHSWSVSGWGIANSLKKNNIVHLFPTDGIKHLPNYLKENVIGYTELNKPLDIKGRAPDLEYDCQISYTAMKNFPNLLKNGKKNRFGIWCYEWNGKNVLPDGFAANYKYCDKILAPSNFAKEVFLNSAIPESHIEVISHGINFTNSKKQIKLPTNKKVKILANIAQNHMRKNISGLLTAYGKAFNSKDDVCLIIKGKGKKITNSFDVSLNDLIKEYKSKYNAEIKLYEEYIENIQDLYNSIDIVFTMSHCECFYYPGLEALASGKLNIAPNYGGQLDFLNNNNSLLVSGKIERANPSSMYWTSKNNAEWFMPDIDDAIDKLRYAYNNFEKENYKLELNKENIISEYNWDNITSKILSLAKV
jgi:glycosyltransferase involved in cell wall biosynthesis